MDETPAKDGMDKQPTKYGNKTGILLQSFFLGFPSRLTPNPLKIHHPDHQHLFLKTVSDPGHCNFLTPTTAILFTSILSDASNFLCYKTHTLEARFVVQYQADLTHEQNARIVATLALTLRPRAGIAQRQRQVVYTKRHLPLSRVCIERQGFDDGKGVIFQKNAPPSTSVSCGCEVRVRVCCRI